MFIESNQSTPWKEINIQKSKMKRLKFPNKIDLIASPISTQQRDTLPTTINNAGGNHAIIISKRVVSASVPESSNHLYNLNH